MKLITSAILCITLAAATAASGQEKSGQPKLPPAPPATTPEGQLDEMKAEFEKAQADFFKEYKAAKTPDDRRKLVEEKAPKPEKFAERFMEFAKKHGNSEVSASALGWIVENAGHTAMGKQAIEKLGQDHIASKAIGDICEVIAGQGTPDAEKLLSRILAENKNKSAQASACLSLAQYFQSQAEMARQLAGPQKAEIEQYLGKERVAALHAVGAAGLEKKAEAHFDTVVEKYADVKRGRGTLGEIAKGELFEIRNLGIGKPAPEIESVDLEGNKVRLSDLRGKVVVLDIWATWCGPCRQMIPHSRELVEKLKDKPFALVSISFDDSKDDLKKFMEKEKMPWTHWFNGSDGPIGKAWNIKYFPTIYVLDAKGVIRHKGVRGEAMTKAVEALLAEAPSAVGP